MKKTTAKRSKPIPETPEEAKKLFFKKIWIWFWKKSVAVKGLLVFVMLVILIGLCRINLLGEKPYTFVEILLPFYIPGIDQPLPAIPLSVQMTAEGDMGKRELIIGENIFSGEEIVIKFRADVSCWITVLCIDSAGIHELFQRTLEPSWITGEKEFALAFKLDDTLGVEAYYFIAYPKEFSFEKAIKPALLEVFPNENTKGPVQNRYKLRLKRGYASLELYFNHL